MIPRSTLPRVCFDEISSKSARSSRSVRVVVGVEIDLEFTGRSEGKEDDEKESEAEEDSSKVGGMFGHGMEWRWWRLEGKGGGGRRSQSEGRAAAEELASGRNVTAKIIFGARSTELQRGRLPVLRRRTR